MSRSPCPKIRTCEIPVSRDNYISTCSDAWRGCPLNAWKTPRKWLEEIET